MTTFATSRHGSPGGRPADTAASSQNRRTWTVIATSGLTVTGYLPAWAQDDPSRTGIPAEQLGKVLADICHAAVFPGLSVQVARDGGPGTDTVILGGSIEFHPYIPTTETPTPSAGVPVAHLQLIDDHWIHNLDPFALGAIAAKLRAQADHLDHHVRPALTAARADWTAAHRTGLTGLVRWARGR